MLDVDSDLALNRAVLDASALRARVVMHNLANQNTPGFKRYYVRFEDQLREASRAGREPGEVRATLQRDDSGPRHRNNVSAVDELNTLEKVRMLQDIVARRTGGYFRHINHAIYGRPS